MSKNTTEHFNPDTSGLLESEEYKRKKAQEEAIKASKRTLGSRIAAFFHDDRTRLAMGIVMLLVGGYFLFTFSSYAFMSAGLQDQSRVDGFTVMQNAQQPSSIHNAGAAVGASTSQFLIAHGVGVAAFIIVLWFFTIGVRLLNKRRKVFFYSYTLLSLYGMFACSMIVGVFTMNLNLAFFPLGGDFGYFANMWLHGLIGSYGMYAVNLFIAVLWVLLCYNTLSNVYSSARKQLGKAKSKLAIEHDLKRDPSPFAGGNQSTPSEPAPAKPASSGEKPASAAAPAPAVAVAPPTPTNGVVSPINRVPEPVNPQPKPSVEPIETADVPGKMKKIDKVSTASGELFHDPTLGYTHYRFPTLDLLQKIEMQTDRVDVDEQESNKQRITDILRNYGIEIKRIEVHVGPTVTLFEIVPADGVRISKIKNLEDDIALSLSALGIRIIAPMPGRGTIGIEVPNRDPQVVSMYEVLQSKAFQQSKAALPMVLGCTVSNDVFVADLIKMPHLLVAGATGQGKSVGLNAIITSLLYKKGPSELKFVLVDPKKVEFSLYEDLQKYFFAKVPGLDESIITETDHVVKALNSVVNEMENRYKVLQDAKVRNVEAYNEKWKDGLRFEKDSAGNEYRYMPYIVVIIDEFSDLIMVAGKEVETPIVRIAQKARAVGIHMIIATQRPSTKVITGLIKANFPGRMAFRVTQGVDSRIIIDRPGAERLIGRGDMLFNANSTITRLQCPFVDTPDVERICAYIKEQEDADTELSHEHPYELPESIGPDDGTGSQAGNLSDRDPLFEEAVRWIVQNDVASTSSLQRRYQIGYNRAGRIMDQMEMAGIVGPSQGGKPRAILVDPMWVDQMFQQQNNQQ